MMQKVKQVLHNYLTRGNNYYRMIVQANVWKMQLSKNMFVKKNLPEEFKINSYGLYPIWKHLCS